MTGAHPGRAVRCPGTAPGPARRGRPGRSAPAARRRPFDHRQPSARPQGRDGRPSSRRRPPPAPDRGYRRRATVRRGDGAHPLTPTACHNGRTPVDAAVARRGTGVAGRLEGARRSGRARKGEVDLVAGVPVLSLRGVFKRFGAVQALSGIDLDVRSGEVLALVGDNGAGKSTLVKAISGVGPLDSGTIRWQGRAVNVRRPQDAQRLGIATVHQDLSLCDNLDVVGNLFLGRELRRFGVLREVEMERRTRALLDSLSIRVPSVRVPIASLSGGQRQAVAIARALIGAPELVILDEPTAALGVEQSALVLDLINRLRRQGMAVILISHNLEDVRAVADRVAVLRLGRNNGLFEVKYTTQEQIIFAITGSHTLAVTLQHSLLPQGLPDQSALDVAFRYLPAQAGVGGDWFDVIPLPGARVALVVGDVVGHGLHAAATMGRLRTAVQNFSSLDLAPDEILGHLDDLVSRIDQDQKSAGDGSAIIGATCLYAIYDPVSRVCQLARAGHLPAVLVHPDGTVEIPDTPVGPPLGLFGGLPFECAELHLPAGSQLVLYTDGLIEDRNRDIDQGLDLLRNALAGPARTPQDTCQDVIEALLPDQPEDDVALLVARTRALPHEFVADWDIPADPAAVAGTRAAVTERLRGWGLEDLAFTTELIISELVTNAIRYTGGPIHLRVLRDRTLICEVSDTSTTTPHLRHAADTDEGGRGLFLIAQLSSRWGTRYIPTGKIIWAEQQLP
ncbi:SpoIIE family protein phosphatase [Kitasatospora sp. NBC_00315]|uniref:SpoIIE family protein phosphatase n=1 Tax=Kitasatospora sp. NBC_00315 TaxID=2975963 RepID=UPI00352CEEDB